MQSGDELRRSCVAIVSAARVVFPLPRFPATSMLWPRPMGVSASTAVQPVWRLSMISPGQGMAAALSASPLLLLLPDVVALPAAWS